MAKPTVAFIALGSNLGERELHLQRARTALAESEGIQVVGASRIYETAPLGGPGQGLYLNAVLGLSTELSPRFLLEHLLVIEAECGRNRALETERWQARTLDLDLLLYGRLCLDEEHLCIPHPRLHERGFVLEPLCELAAEISHPRLGQPLEDLRKRQSDPVAVRLWEGARVWGASALHIADCR